MNLTDSMELLKRYGKCPECGNEKIGNGEGALVIENNVFERSCKCGWKVIKDKRIKVVAWMTSKSKGQTTGIYEVDMGNYRKYLPLNEVKERAGIKRVNQTKKVEEWLNTKEGREWAKTVQPASIY